MAAPVFNMNIQSTLTVPSGARDLDVLFNRGMGFMRKKQYSKAADIFSSIMRKKPDHFASIEQMGLISRDMGDHERSFMFFKALTEHVPLYAQAYGYTAAALMSMERYDDAVPFLKKALTLGKHSFAYVGLGNCYTYMGKEDLAGQYLKKGMEANYNSPDTLYSYLVFYYKFKSAEDPHLKHALELLQNSGKKMAPLDLASLYTILFKAYDDLEDYDKAMEYAELAGKARLADKKYELKKAKGLFGWAQKYFDDAFFEKTETSGIDSQVPVFILGMPRSGTTLLEQILHSHPDIVGIGEDIHFCNLLEEKSFLPPHNKMPYLYRTKPLNNGVMSIKELAEDHLAYLSKKGRNAKRVVDKAIIHYYWVGMLYLAFPKAHFIHLTRDPLSSAVSAYVRNFSQNMHSYTNDLNILGQSYKFHYEIMEHWKKVVPAKILDLSYESLVEDTETQARRVIEFLGLPWSDNCLEFHKTEKIVKTASAQQVRKPIYKDSLQTWKKYEKHLAPLVEGLGPYAPPESLYILEKYGKKEQKPV